jgi:dual specificity tyrosine-phosphorylation-regulated kinase 2/3/4
LSAAQTLKYYGDFLNGYEQGEILDYPRIFYVNTKESMLRVNKIRKNGSKNYGYDDENGDYHITVGDHI